MFGNTLTVVWHAGEPLAVPVSYYKEMFEVINKAVPPALALSHSFQTNGTLINQDWCDFIKQNNIRIGLSIDGPKFIHDKFRVKRNGSGSFDDAMRGVDLLKKNDIEFHVISVISAASLDYPKEIFDFFLEMGIKRLGFNIEETEGINEASSVNILSAAKVEEFLSTVFQLQKAANGKIIVREFENAFGKIIGNPMQGDNSILSTQPHSHLLIPYGIISVDTDGNFTTFSPELLGQKSEAYNDFVLGNVSTDRFDAACNKTSFKKMYSDIKQGVKVCEDTCKYFHVCGGGAPSNKYFENGTFKSAETLFCKYSIQTPLDIVLKDVETLVL